MTTETKTKPPLNKEEERIRLSKILKSLEKVDKCLEEMKWRIDLL